MSSADQLKDDAVTIWKAGVAAVDARKLVRDNVAWSKDELRLGTEMFPIPEIDRLIVVGFGKASSAMAVGFEEALADRLFDTFDVSGCVNVPDDQVVQTQAIKIRGCRPPGENLPTQKVLEGTDEILELVRSAGPNDIVVCLISGGGSALLEKPVEPITLDEFRQATSFLSRAGATIYELNAVRRPISQVKGGRLALESGGAPVASLIISDVIGDELSVIASGPTAIATGGPSALEVLRKFDAARDSIPASVWKVIESVEETTLPTRFPYSLEVTNTIIGNIETAMKAADEKAVELGYRCDVGKPQGNEGDAAVVGKFVGEEIIRDCEARNSDSSISADEAYCQIMGGETTMVVCDSPGQGGRNQHLVLSALDELLEKSKDNGFLSDSNFCVLSGGTDGEDGDSSVAGAWFDSTWIGSLLQSNSESDIQSLQNEIKSAIATCDSHTFLAQHGLVLDADQTFTNVCDLRIVLRRKTF